MSAMGSVSQLRALVAGAGLQRQRANSNARASASVPAATQRSRGVFSAPAARRISVRAQAASGAKERGEWTKFLSLDADKLSANVEWRYIDSGKAVELTITAPDRPGLLLDLTTAISAQGLNIDQARVTTPEPGRSAKDTFLVSSKDGSALTEALVNDIKAAILATVCKGKGTAAAPKVDKSEPISFLRSTVQADTSVEVLSYEPPGAKPGYIITFQTTDRPGVLAQISLALHDVGLEILGAEIKTKGGFVANKFQTSRAPGKTRQQDAIKEKMKAL